MSTSADGIAIPQRIRESLDEGERTLLGRSIRAVTVRSHDQGVCYTGPDGNDQVADTRELLQLVPRLGLSGEAETPAPIAADQVALLEQVLDQAADSADDGGGLLSIVKEYGGRDGEPIRGITKRIGLSAPDTAVAPMEARP